VGSVIGDFAIPVADGGSRRGEGVLGGCMKGKEGEGEKKEGDEERERRGDE
jgi:hypothetical protein